MALRYPEDFEIVQNYSIGTNMITIWKHSDDNITVYLETSTTMLNPQMERDIKALKEEKDNE